MPKRATGKCLGKGNESVAHRDRGGMKLLSWGLVGEGSGKRGGASEQCLKWRGIQNIETVPGGVGKRGDMRRR